MSSTPSGNTSTRPVASNRLLDIPSLEDDGSNFQTWKFRIRTMLELRGLAGHIDSTVKTPDGSDTTKLEEFKRNDREARAQIALTLKDEPLNGVLHATTAKETWDKLNARYEGTGKQTIVLLLTELFRSTLSDESLLEPQLNAMRQKGFILSSLGQPLDDAVITSAMIMSLSPSYSVLSTVLMSTNAKPTTDAVMNSILMEEKTCRNMSQTALLAKAGKS